MLAYVYNIGLIDCVVFLFGSSHCATDPLIGEDSLLGCSLPSGSASCLDEFAPVSGGPSQNIPGIINNTSIYVFLTNLCFYL